MRLADGYIEGEGRIEIIHDGYWGTICVPEWMWNIKDAQVACRQLGYSTALLTPTVAFFGQGNGPVWLENVRCLGNESSIGFCEHLGWSKNFFYYYDSYCWHAEDASVICLNETQVGKVVHATFPYILLNKILAKLQEYEGQLPRLLSIKNTFNFSCHCFGPLLYKLSSI